MVSIGYQLSSEEHPAPDLVRNARRAEEVGFAFAMISDHFHPWTPAQGESPFVWSTLGAIARETERLPVGTGVTCPLVRTHPAIVAHAAATVATLMPDRFFLGVGSGEYLNEHIFGDPWPRTGTRREMLEEAIDVIRTLWQGGEQNYDGAYYSLEYAQLYSLPERLPPLLIATTGRRGAALAAQAGDGLISVATERTLVDAYRDAGGDGACLGMTQVCWAATAEEAQRTLVEQWPNGAMGGALLSDLRRPADFEAAAALVREEDVGASIPHGPDPAPFLEKIRRFVDAGFDYVYLHQVGHDQEGFFRFCERELFPQLDLQRASITSTRD